MKTTLSVVLVLLFACVAYAQPFGNPWVNFDKANKGRNNPERLERSDKDVPMRPWMHQRNPRDVRPENILPDRPRFGRGYGNGWCGRCGMYGNAWCLQIPNRGGNDSNLRGKTIVIYIPF